MLCPYTPEQNEVAERKHHHIVKIALTMMHHASLSMHLWVKAFLTAIYLINRMSLSTLGIKSPYQTIFKKLPDYNGLKVFSHRCYLYLKTIERISLIIKLIYVTSSVTIYYIKVIIAYNLKLDL